MLQPQQLICQKDAYRLKGEMYGFLPDHYHLQIIWDSQDRHFVQDSCTPTYNAQKINK